VIYLIIHILSISLLLFIIYRILLTPDASETGVIFLRIFTAYGFFVLLKITVEKIIANIFDIDDIAENYLFHKHTYRNFISILVLPFTVLLIYTAFSGPGMVYFLGVVFLLGLTYSLYNVVKR